jgi:hypothetical protein
MGRPFFDNNSVKIRPSIKKDGVGVKDKVGKSQMDSIP